MKKVIVITGGSSGIGLATAQQLIEKGYLVYSLSREKPNDERIKFVACNVAERESVYFALTTILDEVGKIDGIINNAGVGISGAVEREPAEDIERIIDVNLLGVINMCSCALPALRETKGFIINIGSVASYFALPFQALYTATKYGVLGFSLALKNELRPLGVQVCCVMPGDVKTNFTKNRAKTELENDEVYGERSKRSVARMEQDEANGMTPHEVATEICKVVEKKKMPATKTVGTKYKLFRFLNRILPEKLVLKILYKMYAK